MELSKKSEAMLATVGRFHLLHKLVFLYRPNSLTSGRLIFIRLIHLSLLTWHAKEIINLNINFLLLHPNKAQQNEKLSV